MCYTFKQRNAIDTQGESLSFLTGDAQGCNDTQTLPAASRFIRMRFLPFVLASTSLLLQKPPFLTFSAILVSKLQRHFWFKALNTILVAFIFSLCFRQLKFITMITAEHQYSLSTFSLCTTCSHFKWRFHCLASGLQVGLTSLIFLRVSWISLSFVRICLQ